MKIMATTLVAAVLCAPLAPAWASPETGGAIESPDPASPKAPPEAGVGPTIPDSTDPDGAGTDTTTSTGTPKAVEPGGTQDTGIDVPGGPRTGPETPEPAPIR